MIRGVCWRIQADAWWRLPPVPTRNRRSRDARRFVFRQVSTIHSEMHSSAPCQRSVALPERRNADGTACSMSLRLPACDNIRRTTVGQYVSPARHASAEPGRSPSNGAALAKEQVTVEGPSKVFERDGQSGQKVRFYFAPTVEHLFGSLRSDRTCVSRRSASSPIPLPHRRRPYSRRRSIPGCCVRRA
jgi:hypothetical protein